MLKKKKSRKIKVEVYSKIDCHLCDDAKAILLKVQKVLPFDIKEIDITQDKIHFEEFKEQIPVIFINDRKAFKFKVNEEELRRKIKRLL
ncbi:MAG: glutaredoxin family protein [bacterium]